MFTKPKVGFFSIGLEAYWPQFNDMKGHIEQRQKHLTEQISRYAEVVSAGLVDSVEKSKAAGELFSSAGVEIVFCYSATYSTSSNMVHAVRRAGVPVILLNLQPVEALDFDNITEIGEWLETCTCAGLPEMAAMLIRNEIEFDVISGVLAGDQTVWEKIREWCAAAQIKSVLQSTTIGMLGQAYEGMMDLYFDRSGLLHQLGTDTLSLRYDELTGRMAGLEKQETDEAAKRILDSFSHDKVEPEKIKEAAAVYAGLIKLAKERDIGAIAFHYDGAVTREMQSVVGTTNVAFSLLTTEGIPCCVEGDARACAASLVAKILGGASELSELYSMDFKEDVCIIGHSGSGDIAISDQKPLLKEVSVFHGKTGGGLLTQFHVEAGPVTLIALTQDAHGTFKFIVAQGESVSGKLLKLGDTNFRFKFPGGARRFVDEWSKHGPSHHFILTKGHQASGIQKAGKLLGVPVCCID